MILSQRHPIRASTPLPERDLPKSLVDVSNSPSFEDAAVAGVLQDVITMKNIEQPRSRPDPVNGTGSAGLGAAFDCHRQTFCTLHEKVQSSCR